MLENIININPWILGSIAYICAIMPFIYFIGGLIRIHQKCNLKTGEPND